MTRKFIIGYLETPQGRAHAQLVSALIKPSYYHTELKPLDGSITPEKFMLDGAVDLFAIAATHLPVELPDDLEIIALTEREPVFDVVLSFNDKGGLSNEMHGVGVSSELRRAFLLHYYPRIKSGRVNLLDELVEGFKGGEIDSIVTGHDEAMLLHLESHIVERIETSYFVPTAGQGSVAVVCPRKMDFHKKEVLQRWVNHEETEDCVRVERSFVKSLPDLERDLIPFSYAHYRGAVITLKAGVITRSGKDLFKAKRSAALGESRDLGKKVASEVIQLVSGRSVHAF